MDSMSLINAIYIYQFISNAQLPRSNRFDSQIQIHTNNQNYYVSLAKGFQHHLKKSIQKYGAFDQSKYNKQFMEIKWTYRQYHVQDNADAEHQDVRIYCNTNQFPALTFCGQHSKHHGAMGLSRHYHLRFYPKLGNGVRASLRIPCACVECK